MTSDASSLFMKVGIKSGFIETRIDAITLFVLLVCFCIVISHLLEKNRWITESITALVMGLCFGTVILLTTEGKSSRILVFNEDLFFIYLLPPIIFNAGFQVKKKQFFKNFMTIILFGVVGTLISFVIIWLGSLHLFNKLDVGFLDMGDYLALGAIFSATDSVCTLQVLNQDETPRLYSIVFGEGVVNDATSIVLFNTIQKFDLSSTTSTITLELIGNFSYLFLASTVLGVAVGLLSAYMIKKLYSGRESARGEVALMILLAYFSYMAAELCGLSGILTVFFCGIIMSHYTWHLVTEESRVTTKHAFATFSFVAEIFIFLYVGMDALDIEKWKLVSKRPWTSLGVSSILLVLVLVGRAAFVFPLSFLSNLTQESENDKIVFKKQVTIWWAGLMRGAVSIALAYNQFTRSGHTQLQGNAVMITSTISVVLFTNLVCGILTKPIIRLLVLRKPSVTKASEALLPESSVKTPLLLDRPESEVPRPRSVKELLNFPARSVHFYWRRFDDAFMRPVFGSREVDEPAVAEIKEEVVQSV